MTDNRIEGYLRKSTRGLWGKKRAEVREELSSHIQGRVHAHLVGGLCESDAIEKTLIELGHPSNVNAGMARLYTLPVVAGSGLMLAMCSALVVVLLSGSTAQTLKISNIFPTDTCLESKDSTLPYYCAVGGWTDIESLKAALEPQGVVFNTVNKSLFKGWSLTFPGGIGLPLMLKSNSESEWFFDGEDKGDEITLRPNADYIHIRDFIGQLPTTGITMSIEGWDKPILHIGDVALEIDLLSNKNDTNYGGKGFYMEALNWGLATSGIPLFETYQNWATLDTVKTESKRFRVADKSGTVYGIAATVDGSGDSSVEPERVDSTYTVYTDIGRVDENGFVTLNVPTNKSLTFVSRSPDLNKTGLAMLVRLSGDLGTSGTYVAISPDQITLE